MFEKIADLSFMILQICSTPIVVGIFTFLYKQHKKKNDMWQKLHNTDELLKSGVISLLHNKIYANCTTYINQGYITTGEKDDLDYLFEGYKGLGGNSTGEWLYNRASELPVKEK